MSKSTEIFSKIIHHMKYAKYLPEKQRRETYEETVDRNKQMHLNKFPEISDEIEEAYKYVYDKKILPSMRSMQFAGKPIELNNSRMYNCSFTPINNLKSFPEIMFLLLSGAGVGISVQEHHVNKLPQLVGPTPLESNRHRPKRYLVADSIEGWADAIKILIESYFLGKKPIFFDYRDIRQKGETLITSGGRAPGPQPLRDCIHNIEKVLNNAIEDRGRGTKLKTIEAHDIACYISDAVLSGGIRRSALISLFSFEDEEMMHCKTGNWYEANPQRGRANNSVLLVRSKIKKKDFFNIWEIVKNSGAGEPGIIFSNDKNSGVNPCQPIYATVLTKEGLRTFEDIDVGTEIWSKEGWTTVIKKWSNGIKPVYRYCTTSGVFYGTENHRILQNNIKVEVGNAHSIDSLRGYYSLNKNSVIDPQDVIDGLVIGDGSVHKASNNKVYLYIGEKDQDYFSSLVSEYIVGENNISGCYGYDVKTTIDYSELPNTYERYIPKRFFDSPEKLIGFLHGLYSANGSLIKDQRIAYKTTSIQMAEDLQIALSSLGIKSYYTTNKSKNVKFINGEYICKQSYDVNITVDKHKFMSLIGFIQKYKNSFLTESKIDKKVSYDIKDITYIDDEEVFDITVDNESHTYWTGGCNVSNCAEISLKPNQLCNLTEINGSNIKDQDDFNKRARVASFIGTLQAGYTDFHYLRDEWQETVEKDALLGVSITGIASGKIEDLDLIEASTFANEENERVSKLIGINKASRVSTIKPSGTSSALLGCSSGIHAWHNDYYIRRVRVGKNEAIYTYLQIYHPELIEDDFFKPVEQAVISIPMKAPEGAITRKEDVMVLLERVKRFNEEWIGNGHRKGDNRNNVSCTISVKEDEWDKVGAWMWDNRKSYNGISVLPYNDHTYKQAPFEDCDEANYNKLYRKLKGIDLTKVIEMQDNTNLQGELACSGGACEVK